MLVTANAATLASGTYQAPEDFLDDTFSGTLQVTVTVSDGSLQDVDSFLVGVTLGGASQPPVLHQDCHYRHQRCRLEQRTLSQQR